MICRDDLELRWRLLMCENEFSHISLLLYISTAFSLSLRESEVRALVEVHESRRDCLLVDENQDGDSQGGRCRSSLL